MSPGSQKADSEWVGRRSGKAPWKIPLGPPKTQKRHLLPWLSPPPLTKPPLVPPATSLSLCPVCLFLRFYHISSTGSWKSPVIANSVMLAGQKEGGWGQKAKGEEGEGQKRGDRGEREEVVFGNEQNGMCDFRRLVLFCL